MPIVAPQLKTVVIQIVRDLLAMRAQAADFRRRCAMARLFCFSDAPKLEGHLRSASYGASAFPYWWRHSEATAERKWSPASPQ